jgi:hypothetical protein
MEVPQSLLTLGAPLGYDRSAAASLLTDFVWNPLCLVARDQ